MKTTLQHSTLSWTERNARIAAGAALIGATMATNGSTLGWIALLPLLAVYPIMTGIAGFDPVRMLLRDAFAYRALATTAAAALVGTPFILETAHGATMLFPLAGVYAVLGAVLGRSPLAALVEATRTMAWIVPPVEEHVAAGYPAQEVRRAVA